MYIPSLYGVTQQFDTSRIADIPAVLKQGFAALPDIAARVRPGQSVALLVGSRGIADLPVIVKSVIAQLQALGLRVFITPCMGSHGGGTSQGQTELLAGLGISEATVGVPIRADMEVEVLGQLENGPGVYFCKEALQADFIVPIVRIKLHTRLTGPIGSGFCKMLCIGAGKIAGAREYHRFGLEKPLRPAAEMVIRKVDKLLCGVCVMENSFDQVHTLRVVLPRDFVATDQELLAQSRGMLPRIPLQAADMLLVGAMGKDISGPGADPNVIGKWRRDGGERSPDFNVQAVLDLTPASHGNAMGMGSFEFTTERFRQKINFAATYTNAITSTGFRSARMPIILENDRAILEAVLKTRSDPAAYSIVFIKNTADLKRVWVTQNLLPALSAAVPLLVDETPQPLTFDEAGYLLPLR